MISKKKFYYNRYPGVELLTRKNLFCAIMSRMRRTFEKEFQIIPISFQLPDETE